jgi:CheY-like chemotaxis protein
MVQQQKICILLVEDNPLDAEAFRRNLNRFEINIPIRFAGDGAQALSLLREGISKDLTNKEIVVLDLNMPGTNGHEFLEQLRTDPALRSQVVFVLTTSDDNRDIQGAYEKNVAGYFTKDQMPELLQTIKHYTAAVKLP